jgi:hypothetical protein
MGDFPLLMSTVQRNCDISDARHAGDYGLCTFLLKMREFYRWEKGLPFSRKLNKDQLGEWLTERERLWDGIEEEGFLRLPLIDGEVDPFDAEAANRVLLPRGLVYSAGYGRLRKPMFFLADLLRVEERSGFKVLVSACEHARELSAPPAMLQGRTIFLRQESLRRYLWEKVEEWQWRKLDNAMGRALANYGFADDPDAALARMADNEAETMILHEVGEALAGELLGQAWPDWIVSSVPSRSEPFVRAVRDLLADCLSTLPGLLCGPNLPALHFYFATFDAPRRQLFPQVMDAYEDFVRSGGTDSLYRVAAEGAERWLATARGLIGLEPGALDVALRGLLAEDEQISSP